MTIDFLISTMNRNDIKFLDRMFENNNLEDINCTIINQCTDIDIPEIKTKRNIRVFSIKESGLSNSRNMAIEKSIGDVCVICDDDEVFEEDIIKKIKGGFENEDVDVCTYKFKNKKQQKRYKNKRFRHNELTILHVSSIEIAFRRESIISNNIYFNNQFGLGAKIPIGEEILFLQSCLRSGLKVWFSPITITSHDEFTSGKLLSDKDVFYRLPLFNEMYPKFGFWLIVYAIFHIKKRGINALREMARNIRRYFLFYNKE